MKTYKILLLLITFVFSTACSSDNDESPKYQLKNATNSVAWTAYKTAEKVPVVGSFKTINIVSNSEGNTIEEVIEGAEFSLPIADLLISGKEYNVINFFFGVMANPNTITGKIHLTDDKSGFIALTIGDVTEKLMFDYTIKEQKLTLTATLYLDKWKVEKALESLNTVCKLVHSGSDGVAKVWNDVAITANIDFNESN